MGKVAVDMKLANSTQKGQPRGNMEVRAAHEAFLELGEVLAHDVVQDEYLCQAIEVCQHPMQYVIHVSLSEENMSEL